MQKLVDEEGGVTSRVLDVSSDLKKSGLEVSFTDENGSPISGKQDVGKYVYIHYNYNYDGFTKDNHLETSNYVLISRR
ncbi:hypothetical protein NSQ59_27650 [Margalitia sp. FSL K6-0131]|uniref:hypothetical protein n=1 Tax=Margalitia sp. FSL K6-0131 TaxID=2954604 RepID=UPI0030F7F2C7